MKKLLYLSSMLALGGLLTFSSCKKEDNDDNNSGNNNTQNPPKNEAPSIQPGDANGVLVAIKTNNVTSTPMGNVITAIGVASASFTNDNFSTLLEAGTVEADGNGLSKQSNNSYVFTPGTSQPTGLSFGNSTVWTVGGNSSSGVEAGTYTDNNTFPTISEINFSGSELATNADFTLSTKTTINTADSLIFMIAGPSKNIMKTVPNGTASVTFTAAEMGTIGTGSNAGLMSVTAYKLNSSTTSGGKKIYMVKESYISKSVTLK